MINLEKDLMDIIEIKQKQLDVIARNSMEQKSPVWYGTMKSSIESKSEKGNGIYTGKVYVQDDVLESNAPSQYNYAPIYNYKSYRKYKGGNSQFINETITDIEMKIAWLM